MYLKKLKSSQLRRVARKVGINVTSTDRKSDILKKLMAPLGHYSMMRNLPGDVIRNYIGPRLDTSSLANLSLTSSENLDLLIPELESRRFRADDTTIRVAVEHYMRDPVEANEVYGPISSWDVSRVTDMSLLFYYEGSFNGDISSWDVSNVTSMNRMFTFARSFNGDISSWDVSSVTDLSEMFDHALSFNRDLSKWDVSSVTDMHEMFRAAGSFNRDLSNWNVGNVTDMSEMFRDTFRFNGDLSNWNVSNVTDFDGMFLRAISFNRDLSNWNVNIRDRDIRMHFMFTGAISFNPNNAPWCNEDCFR